MAEIPNIDDLFWKTEAVRTHKPGNPLEGFHRVPEPVSKRVSSGDTEPAHLEEIYKWIMDPNRPGRAFIHHLSDAWEGRLGVNRSYMLHSWFYFTDRDVAFEFRITWT